MPQPSARDRFLAAATTALRDHTLVKLTLGKPADAEATLRNIFVRPVTLKAGPQFSFVWRHATRDTTKNLPAAEAVTALTSHLGVTFLDAHLFTPAQTVQFETRPNGRTHVKFQQAAAAPAANDDQHDRVKTRLIDPAAPWLQALGVTNAQGLPRPNQAAKFRQIQHFAELLSHLATTADLEPGAPCRIADMGSGKGFLTFATAALWSDQAAVHGIEARADLVELGNRVAAESGFAQLKFSAGHIHNVDTGPLDLLIALNACDTATDDALAAGIKSGARLLVVAPCCQKELRTQLTAPPVLAPALRHGIFQERHTEFVTDALRALLLEAAGYQTKVIEFVSTEHTAKNIMIAAWKSADAPHPQAALGRARAFATFYGITHHHLATRLDLNLVAR